MFSGLAASCSGTRSVMSRPKPSRPPYLTGLLVMSRMVATPVDEDTPAFLLDQIERGLQLRAAVAAQRAEDVAGQALGVDPDEDVVGSGHLAHDERRVLLVGQHG